MSEQPRKAPPADPEKVWRSVIRNRVAWFNMLIGDPRPPFEVFVSDSLVIQHELPQFGPPVPLAIRRALPAGA